jgi:hypothetical protein
LGGLGAWGFISAVWVPDAELRSLRRRIAQPARSVSHNDA